MDEIRVFNTHCCGEIGDVVTGIKDLKFKKQKYEKQGKENIKLKKFEKMEE